MPAHPLTELRAESIRADYKPGDYSIRRADGTAYYSGRCAGCAAPIGETDASAFDVYGRFLCAKPSCFALVRRRDGAA